MDGDEGGGREGMKGWGGGEEGRQGWIDDSLRKRRDEEEKKT